MGYIDNLKEQTRRTGSIVCVGLDPVIADIPEKGSPGTVISIFYEKILNRMVQKKIFPASVKPNYAFYAAHGMEGLEALAGIVKLYSGEGIPVILDVKRGDIGKTAAAYADEAFKFFGADAVTLSPYLGLDSVEPFMELYPDRGYYILVKTSNASGPEIQDISCGGKPLYMRVAEKIVEWYRPGLGAVTGATYPGQLEEISGFFAASGLEIPLLIPGVGAQGGDLEAVISILKKHGDVSIHRINSSGGINYAYKKDGNPDYSASALNALAELNSQISSIL